MKTPEVPILYEDEDIIVCVKPQGMPTQSDKTRDLDLEHYLMNYVHEQGGEDEEPYIAVVHRLDRPVGGIMVFAKNHDAAADLSSQILDGIFQKSYQAVVTGLMPEEYGRLEDFLLRDGKTNTSKVVKKGTKGAKKAILDYEVLDEIETEEGIFSLVLIELVTGRHHQIRVQLANQYAGIWGDTKYNPLFQHVKRTYRQIGLYATRVVFEHPRSGQPMKFTVDPEGEAFDLIDVEEI